MDLSEAEIQVLASLEEALSKGITASRKTLDERSDRYWVFKEDWTQAFTELAAKKLISGNKDGYLLTDEEYLASVEAGLIGRYLYQIHID